MEKDFLLERNFSLFLNVLSYMIWTLEYLSWEDQ